MWTLNFLVTFCAVKHISTVVDLSDILPNDMLIKDINSLAMKPQIIDHKNHSEFFFGDHQGKLYCRISFDDGHSIGKVNATWYKQSAPSEQLNVKRFEVKVFEDATMLTILGPKRSDTDLYVAHFILLDSPPETHNCSVEYRGKPLVLDFPKSQNIPEGRSLELNCEVKGYPRPIVTWYKDGVDVRAVYNKTTHLHLTTFDNYSDARLSIPHLRLDDAGIFKCTAYSLYFNVSYSNVCLIRVRDKLEFLWPLMGLIISAIVLYLTIVITQAGADRRIRKEEMMLYRMSFAAPHDVESSNLYRATSHQAEKS